MGVERGGFQSPGGRIWGFPKRRGSLRGKFWLRRESCRCCGPECIGPICIVIHSVLGLAVPKGIAGQNASPINVRRLNGYCYPRIAMKSN